MPQTRGRPEYQFHCPADPDPRVSGKGLDLLRAHGIVVEEGVCRMEAEKSLRPYLVHRITNKPLVVIKAATSLDGKLATSDGQSRWITSSASRQHAHRLLRATSGAILVGVGTALMDRPRLTVRLQQGPSQHALTPLRVIVDTDCRIAEHIGSQNPVLDVTLGPVLIATSTAASPSRIDQLTRTGVEVEVFPKVPTLSSTYLIL